jgi:hypothetical protein
MAVWSNSTRPVNLPWKRHPRVAKVILQKVLLLIECCGIAAYIYYTFIHVDKIQAF